MHTTRPFQKTSVQLVAGLLGATMLTGCGLDKKTLPGLSGPSEFGLSIAMNAAPDVVARDGVSKAFVTADVRDAQGVLDPNPIKLALTLTPPTPRGGSLSASEVTTVAGRASFVYTAPSVDSGVNEVVVSATPIGSNFDNAVPRTVSIALSGPASATPAFTVSPASPRRFQATVFNAAATTFGGSACGAACTYSWTFGSEATATGETVTYRFQQEQLYLVTLAVRSPGGVTTQTQQNVTVTAATPPTAAFAVSPSNPTVGVTVFVNGAASTGANGATIAEYRWDFGNGQTATGATASTTFATARSYVILLTVVDSNGLTGTVTQNVTVAPAVP